MIRISKSKSKELLLLNYSPDTDWISGRLQEHGNVRISKIFYFTEEHLEDDSYDQWEFKLGVLKDDFYIIDKEILNLTYDLKIHSSCSISKKMFVATRGLSVFKNLDSVLSEPIIVGGNQKGAIPESEFRFLLRQFPTQTELNHYMRSKMTRILKDYFETTTDAQSKFEKYLLKAKVIKKSPRELISREYEIEKYTFIRDELKEMLKNSESYLEADWQNKILQFLLLIFPKYIAVLDNLHIKDYYSRPNKTTNRFIDLTLVDVNGHIEIVEIKRPFENCLVSKGKYRDNYTPKKELAGSVMQIEKYIFHLSKWGRDGEGEISRKRKNDLPDGLPLRITNPKGMIILGREAGLNREQLFDFEFIKRKYSNIIDIMTYDDLLRRLDSIIEMLKKSET